jgi:hypothetical protein
VGLAAMNFEMKKATQNEPGRMRTIDKANPGRGTFRSKQEDLNVCPTSAQRYMVCSHYM